MAFDFPNSPTVGQVYNGYVWDGQAWQVQGAATFGAVRYDIAQGLTANQQAQARSNTGVTKKNYIINGAMMVSQENGAAASGAVGYYPVDGFFTSNTSAAIANAQQMPAVTGSSPAGSPNRLRITVITADAAVAAGDVYGLAHRIEGLRIADLGFGEASAKTVTLSFGVKAPAGTYCVSFLNSAANRSYIAEYVIAAGEANTDVVKSVTIQADVTGTWLKDNGNGLQITWTLMAGSTYQQAVGSWGTGNAYGSSNQFNFMGTNGNVFELFDVSLTEGSVAPPFMVPDYASELAACRRYWQPYPALVVEDSAKCQSSILTDPMRANPTVTGGGAGFAVFSPSNTHMTFAQTARGTQNLVLNARL